MRNSIKTPAIISRRQALGAFTALGALTVITACGKEQAPHNGIGAEARTGVYDPTLPYLIFGTQGAANVVEIFVDYRCPHCKNFNAANGEFVKNLAQTGSIEGQEVEVRLYPRPMLDVKTGSNFSRDTATAVVASYVEDPSAVWKMEEAMFALMPEGGLEAPLPSTEEVAQAAKDAGASDAVAMAIENSEYAEWLQMVESVGQGRQIGTPTVYLNEQLFEGDLYSPGPFEEAVKAAVSAS